MNRKRDRAILLGILLLVILVVIVWVSSGGGDSDETSTAPAQEPKSSWSLKWASIWFRASTHASNCSTLAS